MSKAMKLVSFNVTYNTIGEIVSKLSSIKENHPEADIRVEYGDSYVRCEYKRYETNKERTTRENYEKETARQHEEWDRKQFEALKKKFGG